jgi:hypothetical protein
LGHSKKECEKDHRNQEQDQEIKPFTQSDGENKFKKFRIAASDVKFSGIIFGENILENIPENIL